MGELECLALEESIDIVAVTETWWHRENQWDTVIPGYKLYRKDREGQNGGGVALYIKENIKSSYIDIAKGTEHSTESLWIEIAGQKRRLILGVYYRPPNQEVQRDLEMEKEIKQASQKGNIVIMGDFNYPHIDWVNVCSNHEREIKFLDTINDCSLEQLVLEPTREGATLDLLLSSSEDLVREVCVTEPIGNSDHNTIRFNIYNNRNPHSKSNTVILDFKKGNFTKLRKLVKIKLKGKVKRANTLHKAWKLFKSTIIEAQEQCIPKLNKINHRTKKRPAWLNSTVKEAILAKKLSFRKWKACPNEETKREHKQWQKKCKVMVQEAKKRFEEHIAGTVKTDKKRLFKYIRSRKPVREAVGPLNNEGGKAMLKGDEEIAEKLNEFFSKVFTEEKLEEIPEPELLFNGREADELRHIEVSREEVLEIIDKLDNNKSPGPDGIHPRVIKELKTEIVDLLTKICNLSLQQACVEEDWKIANVTPIFKKGSRGDPGNYRPISLTSVPGKIVETVIKNRINKHLETHALLRDSQHGFSKGRSCLTNLLEFFEGINKHVDKGEPVDVIYLDFQKAFDKVPHQRLIKKLECHGIKGQVLLWINNWLMNRKQRVGVNGCFSKWRDVTSGVPQGSVIGPLLFNLFINDLESGVTSGIAKFADDTKLYRVVKTKEDCEELQRDLCTLGEWASKWQMAFNVCKCKVMHIGNKNPSYSYKLMGSELTVTDEERDLGIMVNKSMKGSTQCAAAVKKANSMLGIIKNGIENRDANIIMPLYKSMVRPHLEYCVQFWSPHLKKDIVEMEKVQRRATRMIKGMEHLPYEERLRKLGLFTLERRRLRGDMIEVYKIMHGVDKVEKERLFSLSHNTRTRGHPLKLNHGKFRTDKRKYFFTQRVVNLWNSLPQDVVLATSLISFKNGLDHFMKIKGINGY